ncbi:hypothetical protein RIF29_21991 [Crotalaria pallida]|uniref:Cation/H+ exchanger transmembrane domain-containing protein n=1 Tax=Crotalaria pallida TaxID=3830 RepID=A0AAN9F5T5_CROPI
MARNRNHQTPPPAAAQTPPPAVLHLACIHCTTKSRFFRNKEALSSHSIAVHKKKLKLKIECSCGNWHLAKILFHLGYYLQESISTSSVPPSVYEKAINAVYISSVFLKHLIESVQGDNLQLYLSLYDNEAVLGGASVDVRISYLHTTCQAILANMAPHVHRLSAYASQRLVSLFDMLSRKYNKLSDRRDNKLHIAKSNSTHLMEAALQKIRMNIGPLEIGDYLAIGAIFAATDSVCTLQVLNQDETPLLYSLVFGEGVVNDATSVVLFNAIQSFDLDQIDSSIALQFTGNFLYLFLTSTLLGVLSGLLSAYIIKKLYIGRHSTDREVALMMLMAYLSYMLAELCYLSGILTVFFCGIVMSHYTWHNVTESSRVTTKHAFATLSFVAEIFIFLYVGMDAMDIEKWRFVSDSPGTSVAASSVLLGLVLLGRAAFVFPLSFLSNLFKKSQSEKLSFRQQVIIWWAGLMRGAVSMALAYNQFTMLGHTQLRTNAIMITSTITVVLFSTVVFGLMTKPLIRHLYKDETLSEYEVKMVGDLEHAGP